MVSNRPMKKFLTVYDYGTGGVWYYIFARSREEITEMFPKLKILDKEPDWFDERERKITPVFTIGEEPDKFLKRMMKQPEDKKL